MNETIIMLTGNDLAIGACLVCGAIAMWFSCWHDDALSWAKVGGYTIALGIITGWTWSIIK